MPTSDASLPPAPTLPPGYVLVRELSRRGGARVLRARRGDEDVVLRLDPSPAASEGAAELAVLAAVRHPGILPLLDHGSLPGGGTYVARRWVEGQDLLAWARGQLAAGERSRAPEPSASAPDARSPEAPSPDARSTRTIGRAVARLCPALDHLHRLGFVHGDLKPENVLVTAEGEVLLVDFGLARAVAAPAPGAGPAEGAAIGGSLFALAPELLLGNAPTPRSDLFALGVLLHRTLVGVRRSARDFYGAFPRSSFLDAVGTAPEDLPSWARDLVVALTAREPSRRPRSAAEVGRRLAARLDLELDLQDDGHGLGWPVGQARDAWLTAWLEAARTSAAARWVRVPAGEDPQPFAEHLRLFASLGGTPTRGLDLRDALEGVGDGVALDAWVRNVLGASSGWLVLTASGLDAWGRHALATLAREAQRAGARAPRPIVVAAERPDPGEAWESDAVPAVEAPAVAAYLRGRLVAPSDPRLEAFATDLAAASGGSATRLDRLLSRAVAEGLLLPELDRFRLRPGAALPLPAEGAGEAGADLAPDERELLAALAVCDGRAGLGELAELLGAGPGDVARLGRGLAARGALVLRHGERRVEVARAPGAGVVAVEAGRVRAFHARRAERLARLRAADERALLHRFAAAPAAGTAAALREALATLRDQGCAEIALDLLDRLRGAVALDAALHAWVPWLAVERATSWCALGRAELAEQALAEIEELEAGGAAPDAATRARVELARARIAGLLGRGDEAERRLRDAAELDPSLACEVRVEAARRMHSMGRDRELVLQLERDDPREAEHRGELQPRQRAYLESLQAQSLFRLGRTAEARRRTLALIEEAQRLGDVGREAALRTNLATIERRGGAPERALDELEQALAGYARAGLVLGVALAHESLGVLLRELGEFGAAEQHVETALGIRERLGDREGTARVLGIAGLLAFDRGHARAALEALAAGARAMEGAQRRRHLPLLAAKQLEMRARLGGADAAALEGAPDEESDPRVLLSKARSAALLGLEERAAGYAERAEALARSLELGPVAEEGRFLATLLRRPQRTPEVGPEAGVLIAEDARILAWIAAPPERFDGGAARALAEALSARGRDDRASRLWTAIAARATDDAEADAAAARAEEAFEACAAGLTGPERRELRLRLLGLPDPRPGDFALRPRRSGEEELEMEIVSLLEINHQLVRQEDLGALLGVIVENALAVTGAERGFLALEEDGELRFDTALDSCRGDVAEPELEVSRSIVGEALQLGRPIRVSNAVDDPLLGHTASVVSLELRSVLCVPFEVAPGLRGAIYLDHRLRTGAFDDRAEKLCTLLADQAALAIGQVRRLDEIRRLNRRLQERVAVQESDLSSARRALQRAGRVAPVAGLVGESAAMTRVHALLERMAPSELPVLITGASGTGKELAARSIHSLSARSAAPFVSESCAALPPSLIESTLFGYVRGAFTGAERDHAGLFEEADGGTLFLDEIGELPLELQAKLLRVLETGEVRRIGASQSRKVDFRLVAATNRDLAEALRAGTFREDLYYRLDALRIEMPGLDQRMEDLPLLVEHFLELEAPERGQRRRVSKAVLARLSRRAWPGNVRELRNEIARLCVICEGDLDDPELVREAGSPGPDAGGALHAGGSGAPIPLAELERRAIVQALEHTGGDKRKAARLLGISRAKIYQRLKTWGLE